MARFVADAKEVNKEFNIPLVIIKNQNAYEGFVPGLAFKSVFGDSEQEVQEKLKDATINALKELAINGKPMPFFPNSEEIKKDFENVIKILYLKVKAGKN